MISHCGFDLHGGHCCGFSTPLAQQEDISLLPLSGISVAPHRRWEVCCLDLHVYTLLLLTIFPDKVVVL